MPPHPESSGTSAFGDWPLGDPCPSRALLVTPQTQEALTPMLASLKIWRSKMLGMKVAIRILLPS